MQTFMQMKLQNMALKMKPSHHSPFTIPSSKFINLCEKKSIFNFQISIKRNFTLF